MIKACVLIFVSCTLTACAGSQVISIPTELPVPENWNKLSSGGFESSECPAVSGTYREPPLKSSTPDSPFAEADLEVLTYIGVLPFHKASKEHVSKVGSMKRSEAFELRQESEDSFSFQFESLSSEVVRYNFASDAVNYQCKRGLMYFPVIGRYGADQTGGYNIQYQEIMAVDTSGNLILIRISGPYRKTVLSGNRKFQYDFYRYPRVQ